MSKHTPVLLHEVIEAFAIKKGGLYIDTTAGEGGHLFAIAEKGGKVIGIDRDDVQIKNLEARIYSSENKNTIVVKQGNYRDIEKIAKENSFYPVDGVLFDLGLSMRQIDEGGKGLSYHKDGELLDMRLDESEELTAGDMVNRLTADELYNIFAKNAEDLNSRPIAKALVPARGVRRVEKVGDLKRVIDYVLKTDNHREREKTYARIFQALRIEVNNEYQNIKKGLNGAVNLLKPGGKLVVISFHSGEDRIIKQFLRTSQELTGKGIVKGKKGFERSAKLRIGIKK